MHEPVIVTERLELHHISAEGLIDLFDAKSDTKAINGRAFTNPYRVLLDDAGPLPWRVPQVKADPSLNKWFLRFIVEQSSRHIIGSVSFHLPPDVFGVIEIGIGIEEPSRKQGFASEALLGMWRWVCGEPGVATLRYTVSPTNIPSVRIINKFGFTHNGQQLDEIDGPEDIYEMNSEDFLQKWGSHER